MKNFLADLRFGLRMLRKSPGFALTTIAVLALGIGANAAVFSVVDAVLLRSLPLRDPERVVMIWEKNPALGGSIAERVPSAYVNFLEWQRQATQFEGIAGFEDANFNLTSGAEPERIEGARASANIFTLFGVKPALGTSFDSAATDPSKTHVAVITDAFYRSHFGGQGNVLSQTLTLNDVAYTIVGVLPPEFHLPAAREGQDQHSPKLWVPYDATATQNPVEAKRRKMQVYGRLRDGVSLAQARAEMDGIAKRLAEQDPTQNAGFGINVFPVSVENLGQDLRRNLLVMLAAIGFVLLIACANIANLMLTRAARLAVAGGKFAAQRNGRGARSWPGAFRNQSARRSPAGRNHAARGHPAQSHRARFHDVALSPRRRVLRNCPGAPGRAHGRKQFPQSNPRRAGSFIVEPHAETARRGGGRARVR